MPGEPQLPQGGVSPAILQPLGHLGLTQVCGQQDRQGTSLLPCCCLQLWVELGDWRPFLKVGPMGQGRETVLPGAGGSWSPGVPWAVCLVLCYVEKEAESGAAG